MDKAEISLQLKVAKYGFIGAIIGAIVGGAITFYGTTWIWDKQQEALRQQQTEELNNIAGALYIDITIIEERLNKTYMRQSQFRNSSLFDPRYPFVVDLPYYHKNGIYYVLNKEISRFDKVTSRNLYAFYNNIIELENRRDFIERVISNESTSSYDTLLAPIYTNESFNLVPIYIEQAKKLKQNLKQKYSIDT
jgi:hypothetical protein